MLVLSRKPEQSIRIGDDITVMVLSIHGDRVRLGITAPVEIPVHRSEVAEQILREQQSSAAAGVMSPLIEQSGTR